MSHIKKEIPILFSTLMVQALLAGRKTQTRRVVKHKKLDVFTKVKQFGYTIATPKGHISVRGNWQDEHGNERYGESFIPFPYGTPGDLLYVRETHYAYGKWVYDGVTKSGKLSKKFVTIGDDCYAFESEKEVRGAKFILPVEPSTSMMEGWHKRNSLFMPKEAARIWLEVEEVRVERLQDISEEDAVAEGIMKVGKNDWEYRDYISPDLKRIGEPDTEWGLSPIGSFKSLWRSVHGTESCEANPWVWVVKFKVLSTTGKPVLAEQEAASHG